MRRTNKVHEGPRVNGKHIHSTRKPELNFGNLRSEERAEEIAQFDSTSVAAARRLEIRNHKSGSRTREGRAAGCEESEGRDMRHGVFGSNQQIDDLKVKGRQWSAMKTNKKGVQQGCANTCADHNLRRVYSEVQV